MKNGNEKITSTKAPFSQESLLLAPFCPYCRWQSARFCTSELIISTFFPNFADY